MTSATRPKKHGRQIVMIDREAEENGNETSPLLGAGADDESEGSSEGEWVAVTDFDHLPWWRRPSVYWLLGPYFLFTLAFGGIIVPKLNLIVTLVCRTHYADKSLLILGGDNPQCNTPPVQKEVATFTLIISVLTGILSAISAPKIGALSDRYGRTRLLTIASCGGVLNEVTTIFAAKYPNVVDYRWLLLGSFFDGVAGSFTAGGILSTSYASDCTPPSKRGVAIGYLQACLFSGLAFGPLLAGYLVKYTGDLLSIFYIALGSHIFFILFVLFITPESLSKKRQMIAREKHQSEQDLQAERRRSSVASGTSVMGPRVTGFLTDNLGEWFPALLTANPFAPLKVLVPSGRENRAVRRNMIILAILDVVILSSAMGSGTATLLYIEYMFNWGTFEASRYVSLTSFIRVVVLLGFLPLISYYFRILPMRRRLEENGEQATEKNAGADELDVWMIRLALISDLTGILGYIFARRAEVFVVFGIITAFGGLGGAVIQSAMTKHVPGERVGSLLGATGLLHSLGRVFAPMLFNGLYAATVETFPQAFFVLLASIFGLALAASIFLRPHLFLQEEGSVSAPASEPEPAAASQAELTTEAEVTSETLPRV